MPREVAKFSLRISLRMLPLRMPLRPAKLPPIRDDAPRDGAAADGAVPPRETFAVPPAEAPGPRPVSPPPCRWASADPDRMTAADNAAAQIVARCMLSMIISDRLWRYSIFNAGSANRSCAREYGRDLPSRHERLSGGDRSSIFAAGTATAISAGQTGSRRMSRVAE